MSPPERPLRVTWLGHGAERTGPPIYLLRLLQGLRSHPEVEPSVVLLEGGPLLDDLAALAPTRVLEPSRLTGIRRAGAAGLSRVGAPRAASALIGAARPGGPAPDVVVVNTAGSIRALPGVAGPPRRLVGHVHELATGLGYWLDPAWRDRVLHESDEIWVVADAVAEHLATTYGVDRERMRTHRGVLAPGALDPLDPAIRVERRARLGLDDDDVLVGASGTLDWRKAPDLLLELAQRTIASARARVHVAWIGGDPSSPWGALLVDLARRVGLADRIHLIPEDPQPARWFAALDLFVLPSREDAYPLVCLEAGAAGIPTLTFTSGGAAELVAGGGGAVVPYPDVAALARLVADWSDDPARRRLEGERARAAAALHTVERALPPLIADLQRLART